MPGPRSYGVGSAWRACCRSFRLWSVWLVSKEFAPVFSDWSVLSRSFRLWSVWLVSREFTLGSWDWSVLSRSFNDWSIWSSGWPRVAWAAADPPCCKEFAGEVGWTGGTVLTGEVGWSSC